MLLDNERILDAFFSDRGKRPYLRGAIGQWLTEAHKHCTEREKMQARLDPMHLGPETDAVEKAQQMFDAVNDVLKVWDALVDFAAEQRNEVIR